MKLLKVDPYLIYFFRIWLQFRESSLFFRAKQKRYLISLVTSIVRTEVIVTELPGLGIEGMTLPVSCAILT